MGFPEVWPVVYFDANLGAKYSDIDVSIEEIAQRMRDEGCSDKAIGQTSIYFSSEAVSLNLPGDPPDPIGGAYFPNSKTIVCYLGSTDEDYEASMAEIKPDHPMKPIAVNLLNAFENEGISKVVMHEVHHAVEDHIGVMAASDDRVSPLSDLSAAKHKLKKIGRGAKIAQLAPLTLVGGAWAEAATHYLKPTDEYIALLGGLALGSMLGIRLYTLKVMDNVREAYRQREKDYDDSAFEKRANANADDSYVEFFLKYGKAPVSARRNNTS